ncbi:MAG: succinyldiaminopimelate transaminase [Burkholderiales bacterium]
MSNHLLRDLQPYPFQRFSKILEPIEANKNYQEIRLSIGEPRHETPRFITDALDNSVSKISSYPTTQGSNALREACADWIKNRHGVSEIDPQSNILPVNGTREALFAFAQVVLTHSDEPRFVGMPNPFYQIYEGAAILGGAKAKFLNLNAENNFRMNCADLSPETWKNVALLYVCNPGNPTGHVMSQTEWEEIFTLSEQYNFVVAADECYSEIYFDEAKPPLGALAAAKACGRNLDRLVVFSSLSKRSNVPGMRSGFVCGDKEILKDFLLYRTYHGSAMNPAVQEASIAAWSDETHVIKNRELYQIKFSQFIETLSPSIDIDWPDAGFYVWMKTPINDIEFAKGLFQNYNVIVLPGSLLGRVENGINPGENRVRIALVAEPNETAEAAKRIKDYLRTI